MKPDKEIPAGLWATIVIEIIIDVVAIVVCYKKGFLSYDYGTPEILHGAHAKCISRKALGFFRFVFMVYSFAIVMHAVQQGTWSYRYFTVWNYTTLFLLFLFLFAHSVTDKLPIWFSNFTFSMYHIEFTMIFVVDIIYWTMLFDGDATFLVRYSLMRMYVHVHVSLHGRVSVSTSIGVCMLLFPSLLSVLLTSSSPIYHCICFSAYDFYSCFATPIETISTHCMMVSVISIANIITCTGQDVNVHLVNAVLLILETSLNRFYMVPGIV